MNIRIGNSFSGGLIDYLLFGVLQGKDKTNWPNVLLMGVIWFFLYFFVFTFCIKKFHVGIPGMEVKDDQQADAIMASVPKTNDKLYNESSEIIAALGGRDNIQTVSACATRLRVSLKDNTKVNDDVFKRLGAPGVLKVAGGVQAILGGKADLYSQEINDMMTNPDFTQKNNAQVDQPTNTKHVTKNVIFTAPVNGKFENLAEVKDEVFSKKMMGDGFAVEPSDGAVYSPVQGKVVSIFKTKHAIGLQTEEGLEVLLHLGLDTVELEGKPFEMNVKQGDKVTYSTKLVNMDMAQIRKAGKDPVVLTIITNTQGHVATINYKVEADTEVKAQEQVVDVLTK